MKKMISVVVLLLLLSGCSQIRNLGFKSYRNTFTNNIKKNTTSMTLYKDFTTIATVKATHFNKKLMEQYIKYTQGINVANDKNKKYKKILNEFNHYDIYWVAFYTDNDDINNLANKDSFWSIYLSCNGKTYFPKDISSMRITLFTSQWLYIIHATNWFRQYSLKFKKGVCKQGTIHLVITSYLGNINLTFGKQGL